MGEGNKKRNDRDKGDFVDENHDNAPPRIVMTATESFLRNLSTFQR